MSDLTKNPDLRLRDKPDDFFGDWKWREGLAELMVPIIGRLYRNGVNVLMYGHSLINQSPIEIYEIIRGYYAFFQLSEWRQNNLIDEVLKRFENQPRNVKALIKQQGIYSRLIECQQKKNGSKQVTQPTT